MTGLSDDGRSSMAVAMQWVSQVTTVSLEMVLPAMLGFWADNKWGTQPWLVVTGAVLGFTLGMAQLLKMAARAENSNRSGKNDRGSKGRG